MFSIRRGVVGIGIISVSSAGAHDLQLRPKATSATVVCGVTEPMGAGVLRESRADRRDFFARVRLLRARFPLYEVAMTSCLWV